MKISPIQGTPTLPATPSTGLSPERMERLKAIARGDTPAAEGEEEKKVIQQVEPPSNKVIKMKTAPEVEEAPTAPQEGVATTELTQENAISDTDAQAKPALENSQQVSPQIAALAREKRALQVKARELAEKEKALLEQKGSDTTIEQRIKTGQALKVLQELGVTYDDLTQQILGNSPQLDPVKTKEEILQAIDKKLEDRDAAQEQAVFEHMQKNVGKAIASEKYPFVKAGRAQDKVMELIKRAWKDEGEVLDEEEALQMIEEELKTDAKTYASLLKEPDVTEPAAAEPPKQTPAVRPGVKTLTNKDSARPGLTRRQRALAAFTGQK